MTSLDNKSLVIHYRADSVALNICNNHLEIKFLKESYNSTDQGFHFMDVIEDLDQFVKENKPKKVIFNSSYSDNPFIVLEDEEKDEEKDVEDMLDRSKLIQHGVDILNRHLNANPIVFSFINEYGTNININPLIYIEEMELIDNTPYIEEGDENYE